MRRRATMFSAAIIGWGAATAAVAGEPARVAVPQRTLLIASDLRLGAAVPVADHHIHLDTPDGRLRRGIGGTLVNLLPFESSRFHLSVGTRLFGRPRASGALDERGLLAAPRFGGSGRGARRFAPALLMGIDEPAGGGVSLGLDAGVVMGPAMDRMRGPRGLRRVGGDGGGMPRGANGVARVTMGYRF